MQRMWNINYYINISAYPINKILVMKIKQQSASKIAVLYAIQNM